MAVQIRLDDETLTVFKDLIALRNTQPALRRGGMRWLIALDDALGYLRETEDERILVVASRAPWSGALLPAALCGDTAPRPSMGVVISGSPVVRWSSPARARESASGGWPSG